MANVQNIQLLRDGYRNVVAKITGALDTSNLALSTLIDPATLSPIATGLRIDKIEYSIADQISVHLYWDATVDDLIMNLDGRGEIEARSYGGLTNPKSAGSTGAILMLTTGWASGIQDYTIILEMVKMGVTA